MIWLLNEKGSFEILMNPSHRCYKRIVEFIDGVRTAMLKAGATLVPVDIATQPCAPATIVAPSAIPPKPVETKTLRSAW